MSVLDDIPDRPVTLVVAPAGAGKTTSIAAWCHAHPGLRVSWVRSGAGLTPRWLGVKLGDAAGVSMPDGGDVLDKLSGVRALGVVIVDDAHLMPSAAFRLVDEVLRTSPDAVRLVLLCRWDPPLGKLTPTMRGQLRVLRGDAFRLSDDEARRLVRLHAPELPSELVDVILERARGWAAIVALAARTVAAAQDPQAAAERLADHGMGVADLLANQVFTTLGDRTRHLLLCIADEEPVTAATAAALTGDPMAGELLTELSESGLLVLREDGPRDAGSADASVFRVHPLLAEVIRRRLHQGGVAVAQARACVRKAALSDLAQGNVPEAFRRLVRAHAWADAVAVMADRGDELIMKVPSSDIRAVAQVAPHALQAAPRAWVAVALDRWVDSDPNEAAHWIRRVLAQPVGSFPRAELALLRLLAVRIGGDSPSSAVAQARIAVEDEQLGGAAPALSAWLLLELGVAEAWLGDLARAETHFRWAASVAEAVSRQLLAATLSQLAQTEYLIGNHHDADVLVTRMLARMPDTGAMNAVAARAHVVRDLISPYSGSASEVDELASVSFPPALDDPLTRVLRTICVGRRLRLSEADRASDAWPELPPDMPPTPPHVRARLVLERCLPAVIRSDVPAIVALREELLPLDAAAETTLLNAVLADLDGGISEAAWELEPAASCMVPQRLPHTWAIAAVYRAALLDAAGEPESALLLLQDTASACAAQRVVRPFYWPSVHGTPTSILLGRLRDRSPSPWLSELQQAVAAWEQVSGRYGWSHRRRPWYSVAGVVIPPLTRRERDVLGELARGSTYADIAQTLFVTENTVKTHVSAAYAKLGVTRRSEALKVARTVGLV